MIRNRRRPHALRRDASGIAMVEFALISPVFMLTMMGVFDIGYGYYNKALLEGAVESAGRISTLENTTSATIDNIVRTQVQGLNRLGNLQFTRTYYQNYTDVVRPEELTDTNANGVRDAGECFVDRNGNNIWDADVGLPGRGGAQDVVLYSASLQYNRIFPLWRFLGQPEAQVITGTTYLRNQPFSAQAARVGVRICT